MTAAVGDRMDTAGRLVDRHRTDYVPPLLVVRSTRTVNRVVVAREYTSSAHRQYSAAASRRSHGTVWAAEVLARGARKGEPAIR